MEDVENLLYSYSSASYEQRFNCLICWAPKLRMIYGSCQHRLCESCLYDAEGERRAGLERCPTCQRRNAFPATRPDIPEDNIAIQVQLGVRKCPNYGCTHQTWDWELPLHLEECPFVSKKVKKHKRRKSAHNPGYDSETDKPTYMNLRNGSKKPVEPLSERKSIARSEEYRLRPRRSKRKTK